MATISRIPVSEYLHEIYRPDRDYVDGEVQERNRGEKEHSAWQGALAEYFRRHRKQWELRVYPEFAPAGLTNAFSSTGSHAAAPGCAG
jgi:hypothetical protein